jgi:hypothetical protein
MVFFFVDDLFIPQEGIDLLRFVTMSGCDQKFRQLDLQIPILLVFLRILLQKSCAAFPIASGAIQIGNLEDRCALVVAKLFDRFFELFFCFFRLKKTAEFSADILKRPCVTDRSTAHGLFSAILRI